MWLYMSVKLGMPFIKPKESHASRSFTSTALDILDPNLKSRKTLEYESGYLPTNRIEAFTKNIYKTQKDCLAKKRLTNCF